MIDNNKINLLNDEFSHFSQKAKEAQEAGNLDGASRFYILAAKKLVEIAEICPDRLKAAKVSHAKQLIELAESLKNRAPLPPKRPQQRPTGGNGGSNEQADGEDGTKWTASAIPDISFDDIAGLEDVKRVITLKMINPIKYPEKYKTYDIRTGGGVLLFGPPGTGKTMIAKAIAHEVGATFYQVKASDVISKWVGESEQNIRSLFETAQKDDRAIIFIDELDGLFGERGKDVHNDRRVNEFLQHMDGFVAKSDNLLLLGATNLPWMVDAAAKRPGRFSQEIYVPLPDYEARRFLVAKSLKKFKANKVVDVELVAKVLEGYSGADISEICDRAKSRCLDRDLLTSEAQTLTMDDFYAVISTSRPSVSQADLAKYEKYAKIDTSRADALMQGMNGNFKFSETPKAPEQPKAPELPKEEPKEEPKAPEMPKEEPKAPEVPKQEPKKEQSVEVEFENTKISVMPDEKPVLAFFVSEKAEWIDLVIDGKTYGCTGRLRTWESDPLDIESGEYEVTLKSEKFTYKTTIEFVKGLSENDLF